MESISVAKSKRIIRPLVSKCHALTDLENKYPSLLDFNFPLLEFSNKNIHHDLQGVFTKFVHPRNSAERLESLKPFLTDELFRSYKEVYVVFKNVITALVSHKHEKRPVAKLSSLCSLQVGRSIATSTKSTYHKLSRSLLFNPNEFLPELQQLHQLLSDEIDDWLELEPKLVGELYRVDFLLGYVIHLVLFNLQWFLYLLVPALIHWLEDEFKATGNYEYRTLLRYFFHEFWAYGSVSDGEFDNLKKLSGFACSINCEMFWTLYTIDYWKFLIGDLGFESKHGAFDAYDSLVLEILPIQDKLDFFVLNEIPVNYSILESSLYPLIKRNAEHPQLNASLASVITQIIILSKKLISDAKSEKSLTHALVGSYDNITKFIRVWLAFDNNASCYNSLYQGNSEMFRGVLKFTTYLMNKSKDYGDIRMEFFTLRRLLDLLRVFFMDLDDDIVIESENDLAEALLQLQNSREHTHNCTDFNEFLHWVYHHGRGRNKEFVRVCYDLFYGNDWFDGDVDDLDHMIE